MRCLPTPLFWLLLLMLTALIGFLIDGFLGERRGRREARKGE